MVENYLLFSLLSAAACGVIAIIAEWLQSRRTESVARLVFGPDQRPVWWTRYASIARVLSLSGIVWGLVIFLIVPPSAAEIQPDPEASKHVLICLDSSPSMFLEDAGPQFSDSKGAEQRMVRAGNVMQSILARLDGEKTRVTVFGVYTKAVPIIEETFDKAVVQNLFDGLPVFAAFEQGPTQLTSSISDAIEYARRWPDSSTLLLVVSDGDSTDRTPIRAIPKAIADTLVVGVGSTKSATTIAGHSSKQDADSLRNLASQLRGTYFDANLKHLPSRLLDRLSVVQPRVVDDMGIREVALVVVVFGSIILSLLLPALTIGGIPEHQRLDRSSDKFGQSSRLDTSVAGGVNE